MKRRDFLAGTATGVALGAGALALSACGEDKKEEKKAAPAVLKKKRELKMVTTWPKNFPGLGTGAARAAQRITDMSDGELTVKLFSAGELVPALESFDAVSNGTADMYHGAEYYWQGKHKAFNFFTAVPFGLTAGEMDAWIHHGGGQALWDELASGFNVKPFACGNTGVQMGGWFNKEINSVEDLKGLKIRMPGLGGEVLRKLGAAAITLPGGEIFPSLQSGAIDATEWVGPWNDLAFGFYKVTKFYYYPGFHEPGSTLSCGVNLDVWKSLTPSQQAIVENATMAENNYMMAEFNARNGDSLEVLLKEHGVQLRKFSDEIMQQIGEASGEVMREVAAADEMTGKVFKSFADFRKKAMGWSDLSEKSYWESRGLSYKYD
ncbi:TRAP transporter substrate-binding protein [Terasakiella pusilla]|jgi:TRAP-type mannitol/chloroaromatic compound transport system substrate-binding protein|uniref:TRAP transporter substrate-binding protein n=1 Tax=Terasakiella pusilla TaxID=64973 RepID=UPI00049222EF|nr:TRAP transporter substrate-binding protein [Terasakiella pusilla]